MTYKQSTVLCFALFFLVENAKAQLNLKWSSYITLDHHALNATFQTEAEFGTALASIDGQLVIGAWKYNVNNLEAGTFFNLYATPGKPLQWTSNNGRYSQNSTPGATPESGDAFGYSLAISQSGLNSVRIVIGVLLEAIGDIQFAGMIHDMQISPLGIEFQNFHQDTSGIQGESEVQDWFGRDVAIGDFDGDTNQDVAIGVNGEGVGDIFWAGAVNVIMGDSGGNLNPDNDQIWTQDSTGIASAANERELFGSALAVGDFDGDTKDDLAIGAPADEVDGFLGAGSVHVLYGSQSGLSATDDQIWNKSTFGFGGELDTYDDFGAALAVGDFNGDGFDDLAMGVPSDNIMVDGVTSIGSVQIIYGSNSGLVTTNTQYIAYGEPGLDSPEPSHRYLGSSLATGKLNLDAFDDLAIGIPYQFVDGIANAGSVLIVHGSSNGLQMNDKYYIDEGKLNSPDGVKNGRKFGSKLTISDFDGDNLDDLAIGNDPNLATVDSRESVTVIYRFDHDLIFENSF